MKKSLPEDVATESGYPRQRVDEEVPGDGSRRVLKNTLLIFAKYPEPGRVKTRLARTVGPERAALLYKEMVEMVIGKTAPRGDEYRQVVCYDPPERREDFEKWFPERESLPQVLGDLGERMKEAFRQSFGNPPLPPFAKGGEGGFADRVIIIGSDCEDIDRLLILEAFQKLDRSDLVIGPAADGGYYLIGMKECHDLFTGIPWSTGRVLAMTLQSAKGAGLRTGLLRELSDIDEIR